MFGIRTLYPIDKGNGFIRHTDTGGGGAAFPFFGGFGGGKAVTGARIEYAPIGKMGSGCRVQGGAGTEARVNFGFLPQDGVIFLVNSGAVALIPTVAADGAALVPVKAKPVQVVLDQVGIAARAAPGVQILDPEQAAPAFCAGGEPGKQRAEDIAEVHPSAGGGGEAPAGLRHWEFSPFYRQVEQLSAKCHGLGGSA